MARSDSFAISNSNGSHPQQQHQPKQQQQQQYNNNNPRYRDPEQDLFERRLCCGDDDAAEGIAVRKINQHGKSAIRNVKCLQVDDDMINDNTANHSCSSRSASAGSWGAGAARRNSYSKVPSSSSAPAAAAAAPASTSPSDQPATANRPAPTSTAVSALQHTDRSNLALVWGKRKDVMIPLDRFTSVSKGKVTTRAKRNASPASRVLSLLTDDAELHLDIEAPTKLDRDRFARAFSTFLNVPLVEDENDTITNSNKNNNNIHNNTQEGGGGGDDEYREEQQALLMEQQEPSSSSGGGGLLPVVQVHAPGTPNSSSLPPLPPQAQRDSEHLGDWKAAIAPVATTTTTNSPSSRANPKAFTTATAPTLPSNTVLPPTPVRQQQQQQDNDDTVQPTALVQHQQPQHRDMDQDHEDLQNQQQQQHTDDEDNDASDMSSITGHHHYDHEIVEELHQALSEMRVQLEEARAEAARAVKVAEQAITSAERSSNNNDSQSSNNNTLTAESSWQNTVTHKAAEAAAQAQKRCAEALAKQRLAEERLEGERRTAQFWRKQAEIAEEEAGTLQTRAAAAEVRRAAMESQLESERRSASEQLQAYKTRLTSTGGHFRDTLESALERNRLLEMELDRTRRELDNRAAEMEEKSRQRKLNLPGLMRGKSASRGQMAGFKGNSSRQSSETSYVLDEHVFKLQAEAASVREQFELLRRSTADELNQLPKESQNWAEQITVALQTSIAETEHLRERLAFENASRRKLLHEVQDLRGRIRVYCRPCIRSVTDPLVTLASQETIVLHRDRITGVDDACGPLSFEFDRVFNPESTQNEVYSEVEDVCLGVLEGFNVCIFAFGQTATGKTHTILGDVVEEQGRVDLRDHGIQLRAVEQIFAIADNRSDRYKDLFTLTIVEVFNERLLDLVAGTSFADYIEMVFVPDDKKAKKKNKDTDDASSGKHTKLEIRTDIHGETVVQGLLALEVTSFAELCDIWKECIRHRRLRLREQGIDPIPYEAACHTIATLKVVSSNIATGIGSIGKIQFVDLGGADLVPRTPDSSTPKLPSPQQNILASVTGDKSEWKFANRSLEILSEVIIARSEFTRSVPYRNSTLTHLLMDSLDHDTKVIVVSCVSPDPKDAQETAATLRFSSRLSRVTIGKATKHTITPPTAP